MEMSVFTKEDPKGKHSGRQVREQKVSFNDELYATAQKIQTAINKRTEDKLKMTSNNKTGNYQMYKNMTKMQTEGRQIHKKT